MKEDFVINKEKKIDREESGFTLLEICIVIIISGILMIPLLSLYSSYILNKDIEKTKQNVANVANGISLSNVISYPCPSDRSLLPNDPNYGHDICTTAGFDQTLAGIPDCNQLGAEQGICKIIGQRDTDGVGGNDLILIGGVPTHNGTKDIETIRKSEIFDAWGRQLTYAVSYPAATSASGFTRYRKGVIRVIDEYGNDTAGTDKNALFVLFSHGPDGTGAYIQETGTRRSNCIIGNPNIKDSENCNGDSIFRLSLGHYEGGWQYDDYMFVQTEESGQLWQVVSDIGTPALPTSHIKTIPEKTIGIGTDTPGAGAVPAGHKVQLDVNGAIKADTVRTPKICDENGQNCMAMDDVNSFFGDRKVGINECPGGQVMTGIKNGAVQCSKIEIPAPGTDILCPPGEWVQKIYSDTKIICTNGVQCPGGPGCM